MTHIHVQRVFYGGRLVVLYVCTLRLTGKWESGREGVRSVAYESVRARRAGGRAGDCHPAVSRNASTVPGTTYCYNVCVCNCTTPEYSNRQTHRCVSGGIASWPLCRRQNSCSPFWSAHRSVGKVQEAHAVRPRHTHTGTRARPEHNNNGARLCPGS